MDMDFLTFTKTPRVSISDNRNLNIRNVEYYRHPSALDATDEQISCHQFDLQGNLQQSADARLSVKGDVNFTYRYDLQGETIFSWGADNGELCSINDIEGRLLVRRDGNNIYHTCDYEGHETLGRIICRYERDAVTNISEYFVYAGNSSVEQHANLAGQCIRHYDKAGFLQLNQVSLTGKTLNFTRYFNQGTENFELFSDYQQNVFTSQSTFDATGALLSTIDAKGHQQRLAYNIAGQCKGIWLTLYEDTEQVIVKAIYYCAGGQIWREELGNGCVSWYEYELKTQRLIRSRTERPVTHSLGFKRLQDLHYQYDPVGNVLCIRNTSGLTRFWRNQRTEPEQRFTYDSLYQLASASGREMACNMVESSKTPVCFSFENTTVTQYYRTYFYDRGGNLTQISHRTPATNQGYKISMTVSAASNRAVGDTLTADIHQVDSFFTSSGQQTQLSQGQSLFWTSRQELQHVYWGNTHEYYRYDANQQRVVKIHKQQSFTAQIYYLAALELRYKQKCNALEELNVIVINDDVAKTSIRALHWRQGKPKKIVNNSIIYSVNALVGSENIELNENGELLSYEEYYPYGGTAIWAARSAQEADNKTHRYSGKERDATGLYYYGYRYYQPWCGRWLSADPGGTIDGLNLFRMARNNPLKYQDNNGLNPFSQIVEYYHRRIDEKAKIRANESYKLMATGSDWASGNDNFTPFYDLDSFNAMTQDNMLNLRLSTGELRGNALEFVENFTALNFDLIHFTDKQFLERGNHAVFRSRDELLDRMLVRSDQLNTTSFDFTGLKTKDFVFFSLGVEGVTGKINSRFGDLKYVTPLNSVSSYKYLKYGHMAINDTALFNRRMTSRDRLVEKFQGDICTAVRLTHEKIAAKPSDTLYSYSDFKEALALRIVKSTRLLTKRAQQSVFSTASDTEFDNLISLFYRPQILVPKKLHSKNTRIVQGRRINTQ